jgi:hypothetical protein
MTVSFLQMLGTGDKSPTLQPTNAAEGNCSPLLLPKVSAVLPHALTDGEREAAIGLAASLIEYHTELYEISGCFTDRANADRARMSMEALIAGRTNQPKESHDAQA